MCAVMIDKVCDKVGDVRTAHISICPVAGVGESTPQSYLLYGLCMREIS